MQANLNHLRRQIVTATSVANEGHIASALSILDILWVLYDRLLRIDVQNPKDQGRDRFILSKGHGSLALYAVLAEKGFFSMNELAGFATFHSCLGGHPDRNKVPGVEASTGSLGHGLPIGVGVALGLRIKKVERRVVVLVGDAECNEGSIWESILLAAHHRLSNLVCIVDHNHSTDRALCLGEFTTKFEACGWKAFAVKGHDQDDIYAALQHHDSERPIAVIAETIKGFGCKRMENDPAWHHRSPTPKELESILLELA